MPRLKATQFQGTPLRDAVNNSPIYTRTIKRAAAETARVFDMLTGENAETNTITHVGNGRGCPIQPVVAQQYLAAGIGIIPNNASGQFGQYSIVAVPVFFPTGGVVRIRCSISGYNSDLLGNATLPEFQLFNTSFTYESGGQMSGESFVPFDSFGPHANDLSNYYAISQVGAGIYYLFINIYCDGAPKGFRQWSIDYDRTYYNPSTSSTDSLNDTDDEAPAWTNIDDVVDFYDGQFQEASGLDAYVLTRLNRNQNTLWEYATGGKIPGNSVYKSNSIRNHNRDVFASEPFLMFPICSVATSACLSPNEAFKPSFTPYQSPTTGSFLHLRIPQTQQSTASPSCIARVPIYLPSMPTTQLRIRVLISNMNGSTSLSNWRVRATTQNGSTAYFGFNSLNSRFYEASISGIDYDLDSPNSVKIELAHTSPSGTVTDQMVINGYCIYCTG